MPAKIPSHHFAQGRAARLAIVFLTASLAAQKAVSSRPAASGPVEDVRAYLAAAREKRGFPGVNVAWVGRDDKVHTVSVGVADRESGRALTATDRMLSGSIGKTYVAAVALQLVAEKKLDLDAKVSAYLGDRDWFGRLPNAEELTVRSLMNHTSGIPRYVFRRKFVELVASQPDKVWKPVELLSYVLDAKPKFDVGKGWGYADTNYIVLGLVIEKVTGSTYYGELRRRVLHKHGLRDTVPSDSRKIPGLIPGYTSQGRMFGIADKTIKDGAFVVNPQFEWCGGGLASTTADLARWAKIFGSAAGVPDPIRKRMFDGVEARMLGRDTEYGLGVILRKTSHGMAIGHSGFMPGYLSEMVYYPKLGLAIAIQFNTDSPAELGMGTKGHLQAITARLAPAKTGPSVTPEKK